MGIARAHTMYRKKFSLGFVGFYGDRKGWAWGFCSLHPCAKKRWEEPAFIYEKLNEYVPLTA